VNVAQRGAAQADRQLPLGEEIFLDHVGHFVRDYEVAARALERAGFAAAPVSIQTSPAPAGGAPQLTGTGNVTAMLTRGYIEVLFKTADTPLGRELDAALARYGGVHLAAFAVADAAAAHRRLAASGFRMRPLVEMERPVDASGKRETAAFTIARLEPGEMPEGRIQILTHRTEHLVWQPRWLSHPNGALELASVLIAVADVYEAAQRFARFTGRPARPSSTGQTIDLDRGRVEIMSAAALLQLLPELPLPWLPFIAAYRISVRSIELTESILIQNGLKTHRSGQELVAVFPPQLGSGAWLFSAADRQ
jgi:Glyoxalase-like domain